jgi:hypothetical protein
MTACRCGHSLDDHMDLEERRCVECGCGKYQPPGANDTPTETPERPHVTLPAELTGLAALRVTQTAQWLDSTIAGMRGPRTAADDALAVCALADLLEENWPEDIDLVDALALAIRRLAATPSRLQVALDVRRRMRLTK